MNKWVIGKVIEIKHWTKELFSLIIHAEVKPFVAGQFIRLGLRMDDNRIIQRAYSYVNAPKNKNLEFYLVNTPNGKFSTILNKFQSGDKLMVTKEAMGFFIVDKIPSCKNLWMLATGTAIGPYLSILNQGQQLDKFKNIVLVHAVRFTKDLSYLPQMLTLQKQYNGKLRIQTIVSRGIINKNSLSGRIPALIANKQLEESVNLMLNKNNSHVMLCGNPHMVRDTEKLLQEKYDMYRNTNKRLGNVTTENYW